MLSRIEESLDLLDTTTVCKNIRLLGRIVEWTADGITWEADLGHAELIRKSLGVTGRSVVTPGVRDKLTDTEGEVPIDKEASDRYRANTMRAQYLPSDRLDFQIECRDLARQMQQPSNLDEMGLDWLVFSECASLPCDWDDSFLFSSRVSIGGQICCQQPRSFQLQ